MSYSSTENSSLNVDSLSTSNLILNGSTSFNTTIDANTTIAEIIEPLKRQIEELKALFLTQTAVTTGSIIPFGGNAVDTTSFSILPPPPNYEWCFGQIVSKTDEKYANLYSVIGNYWNTDDNLTEDQFQLPDLRNCFLRGCPEYIIGNSSNRSIGNFQACGAPEIKGGFAYEVYHSNSSGSFYFDSSFGGSKRQGVALQSDSNVVGSGFKASRSSKVYQDGLTEVRPDNKAVNYIIKL